MAPTDATGQFPLEQVASRFAGSVSFVNQLRKRPRPSGSVAALPQRGGPPPNRPAAERQRLAAGVGAQPEATLAELGQQLVAAGRPAVGQPVRWQPGQQLDWRRKKRVCPPPGALPGAGGYCVGSLGQPFQQKRVPAASSWMNPASRCPTPAATAAPWVGSG